jgi:hypothetical protein
MVACIAVGLPLLAAVMHNKTHHYMVHRIKTQHGLLQPYQGTDENELEGTGQGSGASPAIWLIYSVSLLAAFRKFSPGIQITSPFEPLLVFILAVFYVDDGMPRVNDALQDTALPLPQLLDQAQASAQSWERLLFVSGGALELTKCFAYVVYWDLSNGGHRMIEPSDIPGVVVGEDPTTKVQGPIWLTYGERLSEFHWLDTIAPTKGLRTLGVRIAPAGNWTDEYEYRRLQARNLALKIAGSSISQETARVIYRMMVCPKLEYPLAVTQFLQKECDAITSPVLRACMSKMGYNPNMPKEVVYGPQESFGIGYHDYFIEQGIRQVSTLVGHLRQHSETGTMMQLCLQWCQVQAGTEYYLLESPEFPVDYIESCWIMNVQDFLRTYNLRLEFTRSVRQRVQCRGDEFIMDALRMRGDCTATQLQRLNACRMYLQVARVSDIASADRTKLRNDSLVGRHSLTYTSTSKWPRQGRPPKDWWSLWRTKLRRAFLADGESPQLRHRLGPWNADLQDEWSTVIWLGASGDYEVYERRVDGRYDVFKQMEANSRHNSVAAISSKVVDIGCSGGHGTSGHWAQKAKWMEASLLLAVRARKNARQSIGSITMCYYFR